MCDYSVSAWLLSVLCQCTSHRHKAFIASFLLAGLHCKTKPNMKGGGGGKGSVLNMLFYFRVSKIFSAPDRCNKTNTIPKKRNSYNCVCLNILVLCGFGLYLKSCSSFFLLEWS